MSGEILFEDKEYLDLKPVCLGREACKPCHSFGPAIRVNYLIHYVVRGQGMLFAPDGKHMVKEGQMFLIKPGEVNTYTADKYDPWEYIWIEFNGNLARRLEDAENPVISCDETPFADMWEQRNREEFKEEYIISGLFRILPMLFENQDRQSFAVKIQNYICSNYMRDIRIEELAKNMGYSRQHISRVFKNETGMNIREFLVKTRLKNSKKILKKGFSVSETAYMCGYNDVFNFSKGFKSEFGVSPAVWKKQL